MNKCKAEQVLFMTPVLQKDLRHLFEGTTDQTNVSMEDLDLPTDIKDLPCQINWNAELPANISVPRVDLHSLILDFSAVSFLDISALKGLKTVRSI